MRQPAAPNHPDFNPRTPHGVRREGDVFSLHVLGISIHAPLTGCDNLHAPVRLCPNDFNPRTPHGVRPVPDGGRFLKSRYFNPRTPHGVRRFDLLKRILHNQFQSTHPSRGATSYHIQADQNTKFQSTHPSRGATVANVENTAENRFQSTHPSRGATTS